MFSFGKTERLKSKKSIEQLFKRGLWLKSYPIKMVFLEYNHTGDNLAQAGFSVSKRLFKKAVDRNKIKRLMKEAYRLNKQKIYAHSDKRVIMMFIYTNNEIKSYKEIENSVAKLIQKYIDKL